MEKVETFSLEKKTSIFCNPAHGIIKNGRNFEEVKYEFKVTERKKGER